MTDDALPQKRATRDGGIFRERFSDPTADEAIANADLEITQRKKRKRCPICGGFNPGDSSHMRCM